MDFEKRFFENSGIKTRYFIGGKGDPLLFLHGAGLGASTYSASLKILSKNYLTIAPDMPCFGNSDMPPKIWDFKDYARYFDSFLSSLGLEKVSLVGHSFGGGVALNLASESKKISKLVLVDSAGVPPKSSFAKFYYYMIPKDFFGNFLTGNKLRAFSAAKDFLWGNMKQVPQASVFFGT